MLFVIINRILSEVQAYPLLGIVNQYHQIDLTAKPSKILFQKQS